MQNDQLHIWVSLRETDTYLLQRELFKYSSWSPRICSDSSEGFPLIARSALRWKANSAIHSRTFGEDIDFAQEHCVKKFLSSGAILTWMYRIWFCLVFCGKARVKGGPLLPSPFAGSAYWLAHAQVVWSCFCVQVFVNSTLRSQSPSL